MAMKAVKQLLCLLCKRIRFKMGLLCIYAFAHLFKCPAKHLLKDLGGIKGFKYWNCVMLGHGTLLAIFSFNHLVLYFLLAVLRLKQGANLLVWRLEILDSPEI